MEKLQMKILWLGPRHSNRALFERRAVSQAATNWSRGFLKGLNENDCEIRVCTHCREQLWPFGDWWPGKEKDFDFDLPLKYAKYGNVPFARDRWLIRAYKKMVATQLSEFKPDVVLSYNLYPYHYSLGDIIARSGAKWVPIILDQEDPLKDDWVNFQYQTKEASAIIFVSYWAYQNCPSQLPLLHFDGGVVPWKGTFQKELNNTVVYSGLYDDQHGGLSDLFALIKAVKSKECTFVLTGKDSKNHLKKYIRGNNHIQYLGFLNDADLHDVQKNASVFINPRPPDSKANNMIFPSKLFNYISYGKPIVSTWMPGFSPEYRKLLLVPEPDCDVQTSADLIDKALEMALCERRAIYDMLRNWAEEKHSWSIQCANLFEWLRCL